jgi:hypothetical protein
MRLQLRPRRPPAKLKKTIEGMGHVRSELWRYAILCFAITAGSSWLIWRLDTTHDVPAMIQAVGTLVAIVLAVAVIDIQHKLEGRAQQQESVKKDAITRRALSIRLVPELRLLQNRCNSVRNLLTLVVDNPGTNHVLSHNQTQIEIPPFVDQTWHTLHVLGLETSDRLLNACAQLGEMNKQFDAKFPQGVFLRPNSVELDWVRSQRDHLARQSDDIGEVRKAVAEWAGQKFDATLPLKKVAAQLANAKDKR